MGSALDALGQWLTQLSVLGQVTVLFALLLPLGGLAAFLLIGVIDFVGGRVRRYRLRRAGYDVSAQYGLQSSGRTGANDEANSGSRRRYGVLSRGRRSGGGTSYRPAPPRRKITLKGMDENA